MADIDRSGFRVLVVEDTEDQREIIRISLQPMEVVLAVNGLDGLMKVDRVQPDFIISDIMMPEMDGWEFIERVRRRQGYQDTPVIFLSALSSRDDMKRGYETGANVYLTKPYDPDRLIRNLEQFITERGLSPKPKSHTLAEIQAEDQRLEAAPRIESRIVAAEEEEEDPFKAPPPKPKAPAPPKPAAPTPVAASAASAPPERLATRFLIVTRSKELIREMEGLRTSAKCEFVPARESAAAMDLTALTKPDALMLDWQLPDRTAQALAQLFTDAPTCRHRPLVVLTEKRLGMGDKRLLKNIGAYVVLRRPVPAETLSGLLGEIDHFANREERAQRPNMEEVQEILAGASLSDASNEAWWQS